MAGVSERNEGMGRPHPSLPLSLLRANGRPNQFHTPLSPSPRDLASVTVFNPISDTVIREWARKCEAFNQRGRGRGGGEKDSLSSSAPRFSPRRPCVVELMNKIDLDDTRAHSADLASDLRLAARRNLHSTAYVCARGEGGGPRTRLKTTVSNACLLIGAGS